jgi:hypothetical protein
MKSLFVVVSILIFLNTFSQTSNHDSIKESIVNVHNTTNLISLDSIAKRRNQLNKTNMTILAGWAGVNIIQSSNSAANATRTDKAFFNMNAYWNTVNLALAGFGLYSVKKVMTKKLSLAQNIHAQNQLEKILLFNAGLDVGYVFGGLYLNERGQRLINQQTEGYGKSLVLQGSFLLVFDIVQYFLHHKNGKHLNAWLDNVSVGATQNGVGVSLKL